jgi:hypothetical protein
MTGNKCMLYFKALQQKTEFPTARKISPGDKKKSKVLYMRRNCGLTQQ